MLYIHFCNVTWKASSCGEGISKYILLFGGDSTHYLQQTPAEDHHYIREGDARAVSFKVTIFRYYNSLLLLCWLQDGGTCPKSTLGLGFHMKFQGWTPHVYMKQSSCRRMSTGMLLLTPPTPLPPFPTPSDLNNKCKLHQKMSTCMETWPNNMPCTRRINSICVCAGERNLCLQVSLWYQAPSLPPFLPSFLHSFVHSLISFMNAFLGSFIHFFFHSFIQSFLSLHFISFHFISSHSFHFFFHSFMHACIHSFIRAFIHSFIHSFCFTSLHFMSFHVTSRHVMSFLSFLSFHSCHSFTRSFIHSFIHSFIRSLIYLYHS